MAVNSKRKTSVSVKETAAHLDKRFLITIPVVLVILIALYFVFSSGMVSDLGGPLKEGPAPEEREEEQSQGSESSVTIGGTTEEGSGNGGSGGGGSGDGSGGGGLEEPQGCEALTGDKRDWCYRDQAIEERDPSVCLKIQDSYYRDSCYRYIAIETGDPSYCDYMQDDDRRIWCHEAIE